MNYIKAEIIEKKTLIFLTALETVADGTGDQYFEDVRDVARGSRQEAENINDLKAIGHVHSWLESGKVWYYRGMHSPSTYINKQISLGNGWASSDNELIFSNSFKEKNSLPDIFFFVAHIQTHLEAIARMMRSHEEIYSYQIQNLPSEFFYRLCSGIKQKVKFVDHVNSEALFEMKSLTRQFVVFGPRPLIPGITLATHLSLDRLTSLELALERWSVRKDVPPPSEIFPNEENQLFSLWMNTGTFQRCDYRLFCRRLRKS